MGVQDQAQGRWIGREVQGAPRCQMQKYGIDYTETFFRVVNYVTLRMVKAIIKYFDWPLKQLDVVTAFLYGVMKEEVYCAIPEGVKEKTATSIACS